MGAIFVYGLVIYVVIGSMFTYMIDCFRTGDVGGGLTMLVGMAIGIVISVVKMRK